MEHLEIIVLGHPRTFQLALGRMPTFGSLPAAFFTVLVSIADVICHPTHARIHMGTISQFLRNRQLEPHAVCQELSRYIFAGEEMGRRRSRGLC